MHVTPLRRRLTTAQNFAAVVLRSSLPRIAVLGPQDRSGEIYAQPHPVSPGVERCRQLAVRDRGVAFATTMASPSVDGG